jgi:hypothetical protein
MAEADTIREMGALFFDESVVTSLPDREEIVTVYQLGRLNVQRSTWIPSAELVAELTEGVLSPAQIHQLLAGSIPRYATITVGLLEGRDILVQEFQETQVPSMDGQRPVALQGTVAIIHRAVSASSNPTSAPAETNGVT